METGDLSKQKVTGLRHQRKTFHQVAFSFADFFPTKTLILGHLDMPIGQLCAEKRNLKVEREVM